VEVVGKKLLKVSRLGGLSIYFFYFFIELFLTC
jgi:hypothetical protein